MKKLIFMFVAIAAISFASCTENKTTVAVDADSTAVDTVAVDTVVADTVVADTVVAQ